jgi:hypothetical protein
MDIGSLSAAVSSLKAAGDIAKAMLTLRDATLLQNKVIELNAAILAAQHSALAAQSVQSGMLERIRDLENQVEELQAWEHEKRRYQLTDHGGGTFSYVLKTGMEEGDPPHRICAHCYGERRKSILQFFQRNRSQQEEYDCPACGKRFSFGLSVAPPPRANR